jgi:hypothetical protein
MRCINKRVAVAAVGKTSRQRETETELRAFELDVELLELSGGYQRMYPRGDRLSKVEAEVQDASRALPREVIWCHLVSLGVTSFGVRSFGVTSFHFRATCPRWCPRGARMALTFGIASPRQAVASKPQSHSILAHA